jgi:hypothetical protein
MNTLREAAQQALEAWDSPLGMKDLCVAMEALKAALAEPVQEPYAWMAAGFKMVPLEPTPEMAEAGCYRYCAAFVKDYKSMIAAAPAAPPQRKPLTDEEIDKITVQQWGRDFMVCGAAGRTWTRGIERAHGIGDKE